MREAVTGCGAGGGGGGTEGGNERTDDYDLRIVRQFSKLTQTKEHVTECSVVFKYLVL